MNEFDRIDNIEPENVRAAQFIEQDMPDEEIAEKAGRLLHEGREILLPWPEFQRSVSRQFFDQDKYGVREVMFQRGKTWFAISAGKRNLEIVWAEDEKALYEGWDEDGEIRQRPHSRALSIFFDEKPFRSDKPNGNLFYEGPELKTPTRNFTLPANTKAVVEQIVKSFAKLRKL